MSGIVKVSEVWEGRTSEQVQNGTRTYQRTWRVLTNNQKIGSKKVREACPILLGDSYVFGNLGEDWYEVDDKSLAIKITARQVDPDGRGWLVTVDYGLADPGDFGGIDDPTLQKPKKTWRGNPADEAIDVDLDGAPIVNSAGDPFDPPVTRRKSTGVLTVVRNERTYNDAIASEYRDSVNEFDFFDLAPGTVRFSDISAESSYSASIGEYFVVTYEFEHNPEGWDPSVLDRGLRKLNASTLTREQILIQGSLATSPVLLDGEGQPLAEDRVASGEAIFLDFKAYRKKDFGAFGFEED